MSDPIVPEGDHIEPEHPEGVPDGATWADTRAAMAVAGIPPALDDLGDPEPWLCGDPEHGLFRHSREFEPYACVPIWAPRQQDKHD